MGTQDFWMMILGAFVLVVFTVFTIIDYYKEKGKEL